MADARSDVLAFALSLPGATEHFPWGTPVAKVRGRVFVFLGGTAATGPCLTVKLDESRAHALSLDGAEPARHGLGRSGWVTLPLDGPHAEADLLRDLVEESYRIVAPKRLVAELDAGVHR